MNQTNTDNTTVTNASTDLSVDRLSAFTLFLAFLKLGLTSFGGPVAHLGFFQHEFVDKKKWLTQSAYADLVALCQALPGPASSQVGFSIGYIKAGMPGAIGAWLGFTMPSAILMILCGYGVSHVDPNAGWLHGLKLAAVAVVAQAVYMMGTKLCPDLKRALLAVVCLGLCLAGKNFAFTAPLLVIASGFLGWLLIKPSELAPIAQGKDPHPPGTSSNWGMIPKSCLVAFFALLVSLPIISAAHPDIWLKTADVFYTAGALVFGGGHVILPLLEFQTVDSGWITKEQFLAGYGAAQALPGPLFTFAAYLGAVINPQGPAWLSGLYCLIWVFVPSLLLVLAVLPVWEKLRQNPVAQSCLAGANASVVGILAAAFIDPILTASVTSLRAGLLALVGIALVMIWKLPPWALVIVMGVAGWVVL